jgi:Methylase involved in ubiquinone/menaquinone biosynthesis
MALSAQVFIDNWAPVAGNKEAVVALWDSMAKDFSPKAVEYDEDRFIGLLRRDSMFGPGSRVLDVGCGAGSYAFALASHCAEVVGIDISPRMIGLAREHARTAGVGNVSFTCADWRGVDLAASKYVKAFDLVLAHMTPAVQDHATFDMLSQACCGWCALSKPIRRSDPVSDRAKSLVGLPPRREGGDDDIACAFAILYLRGLEPRVEYWPERWTHRKSVEEARELYINRIRTARTISGEEEGRVVDYLRSVAIDGIVVETVETTIATLYWKV